jgi:hypothetical protein
MCTLSFIFEQQSFPMDITQCIYARDEYIIQKLEAESVKADLLQMGDINQWKKSTALQSMRKINY